jgi:hypothetical protein
MNQGREGFFIVVLYVDDMLLACKLLDEILREKDSRKVRD